MRIKYRNILQSIIPYFYNLNVVYCINTYYEIKVKYIGVAFGVSDISQKTIFRDVSVH